MSSDLKLREGAIRLPDLAPGTTERKEREFHDYVSFQRFGTRVGRMDVEAERDAVPTAEELPLPPPDVHVSHDNPRADPHDPSLSPGTPPRGVLRWPSC